MAFIVKKIINGKEYYYLNENKRVEGKVKTKTLCYLGKDKKEAEKKAQDFINNLIPSRAREVIPKMAQASKMKIGEEISEEKNARKEKVENKVEKRILIPTKISIEELANFCKRKGFVFRSSDIYGGFSGFWDFGPLGIELFNNLKQNWWNHFVRSKENIVGMEGSIISHPRTWKASGHIENFNVNDFLVTCKKCKKSNKVDRPDLHKVKCECGGEYDWDNAKVIEQMFKTKVGTAEHSEVYLRGETAQAMFMDFKLIQQTSRMQLPFGIAQIGRCFRNEIAPRDFLFRSREFHIGELEFFIHPKEKKCNLLTNKHLNVKFNFLDEETQKNGREDLKEISMKELINKNKLDEWHAYWLAEQIFWFRKLNLDEIKIREHTKDELSHYSSATFDIDYEYPFGSKEVAGNANRGQYDLIQHEKESNEKMSIFDEKSGDKIIPRVIEPTFGMERVFLAVLTKAYCFDKNRNNIILKLPPKLAPIKAAIFPIVKQPEFEKIAEEIVQDLRKEWNVVYDKSGSIGRRYARNDEIGTPYCITIDDNSIKNKEVTIRDRDSTKQVRVKIDDLKEVLKKLIDNEVNFEDSGKLIN